MIPYRIIALTAVLCVPFFAHAFTPVPLPERNVQLRERPEIRTQEDRQLSASRAPLRKEEQASRLARVHGLVRGMKNKMENLAQRLDKQSTAVDTRLSALRQAGHTLTVDAEYEALHFAIAKAKNEMNAIIITLDAIPESENPRAIMQEIRPMLASFRTTLQSVQAAFQALGVAVRTDLNSSP